MMKKNYLKKFFIAAICLLLCVASFIYVVDPFYHYHKPYLGLKPVVEDEINQNPGLAEHFDYDSIIIGSSMTQNFTASKFEKLFPDAGKIMKFTYSAIRTGNMNWIFKKAFKSHDVRNVYMGLDLDPFVDEYGAYYFPIPEYLYDDNPFNDVNYLLNKDVAFRALKTLMKNFTGQVGNIDECYKWESDFSKDLALSSVSWDMINWAEPHFEQHYLDNARKNFVTNVEPHIAEHPDTEFYIFFPPYSILWWNMKLSDGTLDTFLATEEYLIEELLEYDNVKLFGLQSMEEVITNLDNYKDYNHYSPEINDQIMNIFAGDEYVLTKDNYKDYLNDFKEFIVNYDYTEFASNK